MVNLPHKTYGELSKTAKRKILAYDKKRGFGPGGTQPNRNRFYTYLTLKGHDVVLWTVAVKAVARNFEPILKEVIITSVFDGWLHIRDVYFGGLNGYCVDWSKECAIPYSPCSYNGRWEDEPYSRRGMWKIWGPVVNPEVLKKSDTFQWCGWTPLGNCHILDFLKIYSQHPEVEFLAKAGLAHYGTMITIVKKLKTDKDFKNFFMENMDTIRRHSDVNTKVIMKAFTENMTMDHAILEIRARESFRHCRLPKSINALKALNYTTKMHIQTWDYSTYIRNCEDLEMDLTDTKVCFPRQFKARAALAQAEMDVVIAKRDAIRYAKMNGNIAAAADQWAALERTRGQLKIVIPRSVEEVIAEGRALENCLGNRYADKMARGEVLIVFLRKPDAIDKSYVAAEYHIGLAKITQCYGKKNSRPPKEVLTRVQGAFKRVTTKLQKAA